MAKATRPTLTDVLLKKGLLGKKDAEKARETSRNRVAERIQFLDLEGYSPIIGSSAEAHPPE